MNAKFNASAPATLTANFAKCCALTPNELKASAVQLARQSPLAVMSPRAPRHRRPEHTSWSPPPTRQDRAALRRPAEAAVFGAPVAWRPVLLASAPSGGKNAVMQVNPSALARVNSPMPSAHGTHAGHSTRRQVVANPSLKPSPNSVARQPSSAGPLAHSALAVCHATLSVPA